MPTRANALVVMAKAPLAGSVKTRLVPPLTAEQAADLARALLLDQLEHLKQFAEADRYIAYAPADAAALVQTLGGADYQYFAQSGADLGGRMAHIFSHLRRRGYQDIVLIGGDLPPLPLAILRDAFARLALRPGEIVLGPSADGGYYLVAMNQPAPEIFAEMSWSHDRVLAQTSARLNALGRRFSLLPTWFDIDRIEDIKRLRAMAESELAVAAARTLAIVNRLTL